MGGSGGVDRRVAGLAIAFNGCVFDVDIEVLAYGDRWGLGNRGSDKGQEVDAFLGRTRLDNAGAILKIFELKIRF